MKQYFVADTEQDVQFDFNASSDAQAIIIAQAYKQAYPELNLTIGEINNEIISYPTEPH